MGYPLILLLVSPQRLDKVVLSIHFHFSLDHQIFDQ